MRKIRGNTVGTPISPEKIADKISAVGMTTPAGGVIFGDYEKNEANAKYAAAFGAESKAHGIASFASGTKKEVESDTPYPVDADGNPIIPDDAWRYNEAIGTASTAMGMGNIAFSRASKAFGFRTQTGYPASVELADKYSNKISCAIRYDDCVIGGDSNHYLRFGVVPVLHKKINFACKATTDGGPNILVSINYCDKDGYGSSRYGFNIKPDGNRHVYTHEIPSGYEYIFVDITRNGSQLRIPVDVTDITLFFGDEENVGQAAVALGADTAALGNHAVAGGWRAIAKGYNSLAIGSAETYSEEPTEAQGYGAVAIGRYTKASGARSVALGVGSNSIGSNSAALGEWSSTDGRSSFAAGFHAKANGFTAAAFGNYSAAKAEGSFAYGVENTANSYASMAGGNGSVTYHVNSIAVGRALKTGKGNQAVFGQFNDTTNTANSLLVIGKGASEDGRGNAFEVKANGNILVNGKSVHSGADYAEFFEWVDGNPDAEDRIGLVVALDGEKIRLAMPGDDILGIVSGTAAVLGDAAAMHWKDKYLTDEFGRTICDMVEDFVEVEDPDTGEVTKISAGVVPQPRLNPEYDPESTYIPREERKEWDQIGMMGKLYVRDDGTLAAGDYGCPGENGVLAKSDSKTNIRVMKRTGDNIVLVLLK